MISRSQHAAIFSKGAMEIDGWVTRGTTRVGGHWLIRRDTTRPHSRARTHSLSKDFVAHVVVVGVSGKHDEIRVDQEPLAVKICNGKRESSVATGDPRVPPVSFQGAGLVAKVFGGVWSCKRGQTF